LFILISAALSFQGSMSVHTGHWLGKIMSVILLLVVSFFIPNSFFDVYADIARFVAGVFLLLQIVVLIDFGYSLNERWTSDDNDKRWLILLLCAVMFAVSIVLCVFCFEWFTQGSCTRNEFFIGWTLTVTVLLTGVSVTERVSHGALLPSCVMMLYCFYVLYSALSSDPSSCNTIQGGNSNTVQVVIGILLAGVSVCYAGWNLSNSRTLFDEAPEEAHDPESTSLQQSAPIPPPESATTTSNNTNEESKPASSGDESEEQVLIRKQNRKFHFFMACASMYLAMLLTNWGDSNGSSISTYDMGTTSMWIKIASQWATFLLYAVTLFAPLICPDRFEDS